MERMDTLFEQFEGLAGFPAGMYLAPAARQHLIGSNPGAAKPVAIE